MILTVFGLSLIMALPMQADETTPTDPTTPSSTEEQSGRPAKTPKTLSAEVVTCVQTAIETRDVAIVAAVDKYATAVKLALTTRKDALKAAWAMTSAKEARTAIKTVWAAYKMALKDARKALKTDKKAAWDKFRTDRKACKAPNEVDNSSEGMDSQL